MGQMKYNITLACDPSSSEIKNEIDEKPNIGNYFEVKSEPWLTRKRVYSQVIFVEFRESNDGEQTNKVPKNQI